MDGWVEEIRIVEYGIEEDAWLPKQRIGEWTKQTKNS